MRAHPFKIFSGILIALYLSSTALSGAVFATPQEMNTQHFPAAQHGPKRGINPETGKVSFIGAGDPIIVHGVSDVKGLTVQARAMGMASIYGKDFGLKNPGQELKLLKTSKDSNGKDIVHYQQLYEGVPVLLGEMIVNMNANGELLSINGELSPDLALDTKPAIKAQEARETSLAEMATLHQIREEQLTSTDPRLWIFDESLLTASTRPVELVWRMEVTAEDQTQPIREMVLVNAQTGSMSYHVNQVDAQTATWPVYADIELDEARGWIYASDSTGNKIDVISMSTLELVKSFILVNGSTPKCIALSPDGSELAVAQFGASSILFLNPDTGTIIATVFPNTTYTKAPSDLLYGRSGRLYTSGASDYYVHVIDTVTHTEVSRSLLNTKLFGTRLAISADKNWLYVSRGSGTPYKLFKYDISSDTIPNPISSPDASGLSIGTYTLDPVNNLIFTDTGQVWPANLKGFVGSTDATGQSTYIPFHNAVAFASNSNNIIFVSTENFYRLSTYPLQGPMGPIVSQADGNKIFVSTSNGIVSVDLTNFPPGAPGTFPTGSLPYFDLVLDEPRGVLYGSSVLGHKIDVIAIDTLQVVDQIRLNNGSQPNNMDLSPDGNELAVAATAANSVVFINTNTRTISAPVMPNVDGAIRPFDVKYGRPGRLYSSGAGNGIDYLHVFDTTTHTEIGSSLYPNVISSAPYLSISADKNLVYANEAPQVVRLFDVSTDSPVILASTDNTFQGKNSLLLADNSKLFTNAGQVWNSSLLAKIGSFNASGFLVEIPGQNLVAAISAANNTAQVTFVRTADFYTASTASIPLISSVGASTVSSAGDKLFVNTNAGIKVLDIAPTNSTSISIISGSPQSVQISTQFQQPLKVRIKNVAGDPMRGAVVTFTAPSTGASGTFADTNSTVTTAVTDENGFATSSIMTANNIVGTYSVRATAPGLAAYSAFQLTNIAAVNCTITMGTDPNTLFLAFRQYDCAKMSSGAVVGDFNNDNRKDVALSGGGSLLVFLQDSAGNLLQPRVYGNSSDDLAAGDLNHDGLDDVVSADSSSNTLSVYLQRNDGSLAYRVTYPTSTNPDAVAVGDLNSDGLQDVVVSHWNSAVIGVFTQNPNGMLNPMVTYPSVSAGYDDISIGDVNNDGRNDVVKMNGQLYANPNLQVYLQNASGTLGTAIHYSLGCSCLGSGIGIGDVTGDGRSDVVMSYGGNQPNAKIAVFAQDSSGNLQSPISYAAYDIPEPVEIADINSDHLLDVITLHSGWQRAGVFQQQMNGTLGPESLYFLPYSSYGPEDLSIGDVNNDGLPDLLIADYRGLIILYRNKTIPPTPSPVPSTTPPGPTFTPGPGPSPTPGPSSTPGPSPTPVAPSSTGSRRTYTALGGYNTPGSFLCDQNQSTCTNGSDPDADKAHQHAADTFLFYNTHHGRNSFDNQGSTIISTVHYGVGYQNAFWDGYQMVYGDSMPADDVVGHEITHGVTQYTSNLIYSYQSGAINESLSDVWGEFIDQTNGSGNDSPAVKWLMGEDTPLGAIRSMSDPTTFGDPDKMSSPYYYTGPGDNGGVHTNSGVNNKAAYLMTDGGTFNGRTILGIGLNKTAAVYYEAQVYHLTMGANYNDLYYALLQSCQNLVGGADGITQNDCEQVRLAAEAVEMVSGTNIPTATVTPPPTWWPSTPTSTTTATATSTHIATYTPTVISTSTAAPFINCAAQTQVPAEECDALVALYIATKGASWTNHSGWLQTNTPCSWFGVVCGNGSHVTELRLASYNLVGTIPTELGDLTYLTFLSLDGNSLSGSIPPQLGNLNQLTYLLLNLNQLTGSIPSQLGNLTNLKGLVLFSNQLTGSIPPQLGNLANLQVLQLADNHFGGTLPAELGKLTQLTTLNLGGNELTGSIPPQLGNLTDLTRLQLANNQFAGIIPAELGNLTKLISLEVGDNQLTGSIPKELGNLTTLTYLSLASNQLTGPIPPELSHLTKLIWLQLQYNELTGTIPAEIGNLTNLQIFYLQRNRLSGEFPASIVNLTHLIKDNLTFDCGINSTNPTVITFIDTISPGWQSKICPVVLSVIRSDWNPTSADTVRFNVAFSEAVTGVNPDDFVLTTAGVMGASISSVNGSNLSRTVTVNTGSNTGIIRLDIADNDSIIGDHGNPLGGPGAENGSYTSGEMYNLIPNTQVYVGGVIQGSYRAASHGSLRQSFTGLNDGPVKIMSTNGIPLIGAERVIYKVNNIQTSFTEMMGLPNGQLDKTYWLPWYNNVDLDTQLRFGNVSGSTATVHVLIGGQEMPNSPFILIAGQSTRVSFAGVNNGPVKIQSDQNIVAAERVIYKVNNIQTSFTEMMALPNSQLSSIYWLPWYNNVDLDTQLRFGNVSDSRATVHLYIGGTEAAGSPFVLQPGESIRKSFMVNNGPVEIGSDVPIVAAERVIYKVNGNNTSFSEMMALPYSQLDSTYWLPWYNNVDLDTQLRFANLDYTQPATVHIYIGGVEVSGSPFVLKAGESIRKSFVGINNGPVKIESDTPIVVGERVVYKVNNIPTSFSEMMGLPDSQLDSVYWLPWYNNVDLDTQLRFGIP